MSWLLYFSALLASGVLCGIGWRERDGVAFAVGLIHCAIAVGFWFSELLMVK